MVPINLNDENDDSHLVELSRLLTVQYLDQ